jgi:hypothetical protein
VSLGAAAAKIVEAAPVASHEPVPTPLTEMEIATISRHNYVEASVSHAEGLIKEQVTAAATAPTPSVTETIARKGFASVAQSAPVKQTHADPVKEAMEKLANHPNASVQQRKPTLSPEEVQRMMDNFGKKSAVTDGPVDPGTENICIGCE